jgi:hypothetical protein
MTERRMFGGLSFLRDGRMCAGVIGQDLVVRIVGEEMPSALRRAHVRPMDFTGRPMRGFVYVGPHAIETDVALCEWIDKGLVDDRFAQRLVSGLSRSFDASSEH